ncbi:sensor histidine kinase [Terriglobus roseus]|uniref:histidine kinase n=1 Tax=Terriglobus roseus TaxID=392734 RepID=A0A1G7MFF5_9BACT|nr:HAMP domain-containing sensor histidine kinase [Terriglobus roseus]SDF60366.1 Signal transduction histidine kinase [Terriglobus roseus]
MHLRFGFRTLIAICVTLAVLLGVVAFVQYRWSKRVLTADLQREREHLDLSASLFASRFNRNVADAVSFIQNDAQTAWTTNAPLPSLPTLIKELYLVDISSAQPHVLRANNDGTFAAVATPNWMHPEECAATISQQPLAVTTPIFQPLVQKTKQGQSLFLISHANHCFVALLDEDFIKTTLVPNLLQQSFGKSSMSDYDFAIVPRHRDAQQIYGPRIKPDFRKPFFSVSLRNLPPIPGRPSTAPTPPGRIIQRYQIQTESHGPPSPPNDIWELQVAHRGLPLAAAFRRERKQELLLVVAAEFLLGASIILLVLSAHRMQRSAEQRMQFVAAVSHELRTPVSSISMLSRNQADGLVTGADKVTQYGELIHQQSRRLSEMIEQTLQYAGIHSNLGTKTRTPVNIANIISTALSAHYDELTRAQFQVEQNIPNNLPTIQGDVNLLRIAIDNLLSNAIKYAASGQWIDIRAEYSTSNRAILVHISDHGPGIESIDREHLFEPFYRGHAATETNIPGSGIGLSLVRSAAEAHDGSVTVESTPGQGSTFTLRIPA